MLSLTLEILDEKNRHACEYRQIVSIREYIIFYNVICKIYKIYIF